jgi:hypothetical protein
MSYLKSEQHYIDLYDKWTVEGCRRLEKSCYESKNIPKPDKLKDVPESELTSWRGVVAKISVGFMAGERMLEKSKVIAHMMADDRVKDEVLNSAIAPSGVSCSKCHATMQPIDKDLYWRDHPVHKVLFMFECPKCGKKKGVFNNGDEFDTRRKCKRCKTKMKTDSGRIGNVITTMDTCLMCGETDRTTLDLDERAPEPPRDPDYETDRQRFCYSEDVRKFADGWEDMQHMARWWKEREEQPAQPKPDVHNMTAAQLEAKLNKVIEPEGYVRLEFGKPELGKEVVVEFSVQDSKVDRIGSKSQSTLKKLITGALENTNWRLMSDGIQYRMGFLSGRLKGSDWDINRIR